MYHVRNRSDTESKGQFEGGGGKHFGFLKDDSYRMRTSKDYNTCFKFPRDLLLKKKPPKKFILIFTFISALIGLQYYIWYWYFRCDPDNPCFTCEDFTNIPQLDLDNRNLRNRIEYRTISLTYLDLNLTGKEKRLNAISKNKQIVDMHIFPAINGYNRTETIETFLMADIPYHKLHYETWGTLANFVAKFQMLQYQVEHEIEYLCFIEDDISLFPEFPSFIEYVTEKLFDESKEDPVNMIRLARWGEGYVTNLPGAKRIIEHMRQTGVVRNVDNQLRIYSGRESCVDGTPFELLTMTDSGDCKKTGPINSDDLDMLRAVTARNDVK